MPEFPATGDKAHDTILEYEDSHYYRRPVRECAPFRTGCGGKGVEFTDASIAARPPAGAVLRPELRGARVLLVEDSDIVRDVSRSVLEDAGVAVEEAVDGTVAVAMMRENRSRCDLILMDLQMPQLDGVAATRLIRAELGECAPPILALTANDSAAEKLRCSEAGMIDHLPKPLDPDQLIAALNRWLVAPAGGMQAVPNPTAVATITATTSTTAQMLPDVPGFDLQAGLACLGGKSALLHSMLARFGVTYATVADQLQALVDAQNYRETRRIAHTLKGAAATLGGMSISQAAGRAEDATRLLAEARSAGAQTETLRAQVATALTELDMALQPALAVLRSLLADNASADSASAAAVVRDALPQAHAAEYEALRELLAENCYAARKAFGALREKLAADDSDWRAARAAVEALDFRQALTHLDARYPNHARKFS